MQAGLFHLVLIAQKVRSESVVSEQADGSSWLANLAYLIAAVLFILGIKGMTHPRTAVRGNLLGSLGMLIAVIATLISFDIVGWPVVVFGLFVGIAVGVTMALKVQMTQMPQLVALFNGFGGGASVLVAGAEIVKQLNAPSSSAGFNLSSFLVAAAASALIGAVTFTGSLVACGKLQELEIFRKAWNIPAHQLVNGLLLVLTLLLALWLVAGNNPFAAFLLLTLVASVLGVLLVVPIGGADMPVVIALLNSYSGLAAAAAGFVIQNNVLIVAGSLVGASGLILTQIMCKAMNRSLANVLFGKIETGGVVADADDIYAGKIKSTSADEVAMLLDGVQHVVFVPGYGLAVAQAQHQVRDLAALLEAEGVKVEYAIHPVAGRMPGHMNVLLAEADVPYDKLREMDSINPEFPQVDVAIVLGANDVVNPDAKNDPNSPIAGMPILDVDLARTVVVIKRSLSPGFAKIPNPLFAADNCLMLFGDAKEALLDIIVAVKEN